MHAEELHQLDLEIVAPSGDAVTISIQGELDTTTAPRLINAVHDALDGRYDRIELDCDGVWFLDSAGVRALIVVRNEALGMGVDCEVVRASGTVTRILDITGLTGILTHAAN